MRAKATLTEYQRLERQLRTLGTVTTGNASHSKYSAIRPDVLLKFQAARRSILDQLAEFRSGLSGCDGFLGQYRELGLCDRLVLRKSADEAFGRARHLVERIGELSCIEDTNAPELQENARRGLVTLLAANVPAIPAIS
jgi:hypothetical protein